MLCIVARYAKLTPIIIGSLAPQMLFMPKSCKRVEMAAHTRDDCINSILDELSRPATVEMMIAGVTQPTIMATRCCKAIGKEYFKDGRGPSISKSCFLLSIKESISWFSKKQENINLLSH